MERLGSKHAGCALGLASTKFAAFTASLLSRDEVVYVPKGGERDFLAPFPVDILPSDEDTHRRLLAFGFRTLEGFAALPSGAVLAQFRTYGYFFLHRLALGYDERRVIPHRFRRVERVSAGCRSKTH
jgi:nucleotidyltransferase/DNA polymerase involved in DNA repair